MMKIISPDGYFEITEFSLSKCGFLNSMYEFRKHIDDPGGIEGIHVEEKTYKLLHKIYIKDERLEEDEYNYLQYHHYPIDVVDNRDQIITSKKLLYSPLKYKDKCFINKSKKDLFFGVNRELFDKYINILSEISSMLCESQMDPPFIGCKYCTFVIAGEAALRKCCNNPASWKETNLIEIYLLNFDPLCVDEIIYHIGTKIPGDKVVYHNDCISYGIFRVYRQIYNKYESILSLYDVDCLGILYSFRDDLYTMKYSCKFAIENGFNMLWIDEQPAEGYENRCLYCIHLGFSLYIPFYKKFNENFIFDINFLENRKLSYSEYIYYYLITGRIKEIELPRGKADPLISQIPEIPEASMILETPMFLRRKKIWDIENWFISIPLISPPIFRSTSLDSKDKVFSYKDAISSKKLPENTIQPLKDPNGLEMGGLKPFNKAFSDSPSSEKYRKRIRFSYNVDYRLKYLVDNFPIIITGGIIAILLEIDRNITYNIRIIKDNERECDTLGLVRMIHQEIVRLFPRINNICKGSALHYSGNISILLFYDESRIEDALNCEQIDFYRVGYYKDGFITDSIGQFALSNRIHFTSKVILDPIFYNIGFRSVISDDMLDKIIF